MDENHKTLVLTTTDGINGYWDLVNEPFISNYEKVLPPSYLSQTFAHSYWVGQIIFSVGQQGGTAKITVEIAPDMGGANFTETVSINTNTRLRLIYYGFSDNISGENIMKIYRIRQDVDTGTLYDNILVSIMSGVPVSYGLAGLRIQSPDENGSVLKIDAIGCCQKYNRAMAFDISTPGAIVYESLAFTLQDSSSLIQNPFNLFSMSDNDLNPQPIYNNHITSAGAENIKIFLLPAVGFVYITGATINYDGAVPVVSAVTWSSETLAADVCVSFFQGAESDIENGVIQLFPRQLQYRKATKNIDETGIYNRLKITLNNYNSDANGNIYFDNTIFAIIAVPYNVVTQNQSAIDLSKDAVLTITVRTGAVNPYEVNITEPTVPGSPYNSAQMQCFIDFWIFSLGCEITITPYQVGGAFKNNEINNITITAYPWMSGGNATQVYNYADSQKTYGIIEQSISNNKVTTIGQAELIQYKYKRFLSQPAVFLGDGATCDLALMIDLAKYVIIYDSIQGIITQFKINDYEINIDIGAQVYDLQIKGRNQNYAQY